MPHTYSPTFPRGVISRVRGVVTGSRAYIAMTLHSHLSMNEVIGFLSGTCEGTILTVNRALPVSSLKLEDGADPTTEVEADPVAFYEAN